MQPCIATLEDVTSRVDAPVLRLYRAAATAAAAGDERTGGEVEMPDGAEVVEPLPAVLDLAALAAEALVIELPDYPRAPGAGPGDALAGPPGAEPLTDEAAKPFAGLAALKGKLGGGDGA